MPIYEYECKDCGHIFDALQKISDDPLTTCPACGKETLKKQLSAASFQLKGTGWYATDFKHSGQPPKPAAAILRQGNLYKFQSPELSVLSLCCTRLPQS